MLKSWVHGYLELLRVEVIFKGICCVCVCVCLSLSPYPPGGQEGGFDLWGFSSARKTVGIGDAGLLVK